MSTTSGSAPGGRKGRPLSQSRRQIEARERAQRRLEEQRRKRQRLWWAAGATTAVVVAVVVMVVVSQTVGRDRPKAAPVPSGQAATTIAEQAASVSPAVLDQVGRGGAMAKPIAVTNQQPLTDAGKPLILYIGAEYCPYCAAQRWPVVIALSRFGTFANLGMTHSASDDVYPNTQSFSFHGSSYTSQYLAFQGVELTTNERKGNFYAPLDKLTEQQQKVMDTLNGPPYTDSKGGIPFMDIANRFILPGGAYDPEPLQKKSAAQIADAFDDPNSAVAKGVLGTANMITAYLCQVTGGQPGEVCTSKAVAAFQGQM